MFRTLTLSAVASLLFVLSSAAAEDESDKDLKKMAGKWAPILMQLNGKKQPAEVMKFITLTINGNKYNTTAGKELDEGTLELDATRMPREMDIISSVGENKGKPIPCIYELKGNELRICYGLSGTARPSEFKSSEDGEGVILLMTYKRISKSKR